MTLFEKDAPSDMETYKNRIGMMLAVGTLIAGVAGCGPKGDKGDAGKDKMVSQAAAVSVVSATRATVSHAINVTGTLGTLNDVTVGVKSPGKISAVYAREGDAVHAGQVVAEQDPADQKAQSDQAYANLLSAEAKYEQAKVVYKNAVTTLQWTKDQMSSALKQAEAGLRSAKDSAAMVKDGARDQERKQAEDALEGAKADKQRAEFDLKRADSERKRTRSDLKRYQDLSKQDAIAAQLLDQAQAAADSAEAAYNSAVAALSSSDSRFKSAQQALSLIQEGARKEELGKAEASVEMAKQAVMTASSNLDQVKLRAADVENAKVSIQAASAGVQQAKAAYALAQQALKDTKIISPIEGVVAERKVEPGMQLGAGKDVMRIVALRNAIYFDAQVPETDYAQIVIGQTVDVRVDAISKTPFKGIVSKVFPVASATARSFTVRITLPNEGKLLRPNLFARGEILMATHKNVVVIPHESVLDAKGSEGRVFVADGDKAEERKVALGFSTLLNWEVVSGVKEGEKVVTIGQGTLQNGDKLKVQTAGGNVTGQSP